MGRTESQKGMSNRIIDLDIILYGDQVIKEDNFYLPSKDIEEYLFVLEPLAEIAGDKKHPVSKQTFLSLLSKLKS
jgi:2-amino-4-hydroxy-6-hydroxymethyldihydropteridine diphosphokinase